MKEMTLAAGVVVLTADEELTVRLVDTIKATSIKNHEEGREDKEMDQYGEKLVNSPEYASAMEKLRAQEQVIKVTEIDF